ncbi:MAG: sigma-70 family RNA polymerase sigma factor [Chloroflexota bacterium]|nr:sigma-70 family RNA polymerase sigma factor [Chloroflexota bacterium]
MDLSHTPVDELAVACRGETEKFRRGEPSTDGYCFELFRRAVSHRDEAAWEAVVTQYRGIVLTWVLRQGGAVAADADYWLNRTFDRFWSAVQPERFGMFDGLPRVLKYLQMCASTAVLDEHRTQRATQHESLDELTEAGVETGQEPAGSKGDVEAVAVDRLSVNELWQAIIQEVPEEGERTVLYCSVALGMKPAEIYERRPDLYPAVGDVYRVKRNVLDRLRRSPAIRRFVAAVPPAG